MATIVFNYTSGTDNGDWTNEANAWDKTQGTYATRSIPKFTDSEPTKWIKGTANDSSSVGDYIDTVEIGVEAKCSASEYCKLRLIPMFGGSSDGDDHDTSNLTTSDATTWFDITSDANAPSSWSWTDIANLDFRTFGIDTDYFGAETISIDQLYIKVTYHDQSIHEPILENEKLYYTKDVVNLSISSDNFNDSTASEALWDVDADFTGDDSTASIEFNNNVAEFSSTAGSDYDDYGDSYIYQSVTGDFDIQVELNNINVSGDAYSLFSLNYFSTTSGSCYIGKFASNILVVDNTYPGSWDNFWYVNDSYVRMKRIGTSLKLYSSLNGTTWTLRATYTVSQIGASIYIDCYALNDSDESGTISGDADNFIVNGLPTSRGINIYESECGSDGTSCMDYSLPVVIDGTSESFCQITTNTSHSDISELRVRKSSTTYGVLKEFDKDE